MADEWYNSSLAEGIAIATIIAAIGYFAPSFVRSYNDLVMSKSDVLSLRRAEIDKQHQLQTVDINGNGVPEKFYTIDGKIAIVELDGKPVLKSLDSRVFGEMELNPEKNAVVDIKNKK